MSFEMFQDYLHLNSDKDLWVDIVPQMKDLIIDTYLSGRDYLHKNRRVVGFELLGFDFLVDDEYRVWLL